MGRGREKSTTVSATAAARPSLEDYFSGPAAEFGFTGEPEKLDRAYEFNIKAIQANLSGSALFTDLIAHLAKIALAYSPDRPDLLFTPPQVIEIAVKTKPYASVLDKIYRHNVLYNKNYPSPPREGWVGADDLYSRLNDLVRGRIICKYLDGPKFVCQGLAEFFAERGVVYEFYPLSTELGYHSWHFYFKVDLDVMVSGDVEKRPIWFELQIATQLAEVLTNLTHGLYEEQRSGPARRRDDGWKWDPNSQKFKSAFLGHSLHLLEGVIQNFKDEVLVPTGPTDATADSKVGSVAALEDVQIEEVPDGAQ